MSRQINLYQPFLREQKKSFSARTIAQLAVVFIVGLLAIYGLARSQIAAQERSISGLEVQRDRLMAQLAELQTEESPAPSRRLERELRVAEDELERKSQLAEVLAARRDAAAPVGFSGLLAALARQRIDGLWLTHVAIHRNGTITLEGEAEEPELVPRYLARIGGEEAFSVTGFSYLQITRGDEGRAPLVTFVASTMVPTIETAMSGPQRFRGATP